MSATIPASLGQLPPSPPPSPKRYQQQTNLTCTQVLRHMPSVAHQHRQQTRARPQDHYCRRKHLHPSHTHPHTTTPIAPDCRLTTLRCQGSVHKNAANNPKRQPTSTQVLGHLPSLAHHHRQQTRAGPQAHDSRHKVRLARCIQQHWQPI
jgi:hypothetical protein